MNKKPFCRAFFVLSLCLLSFVSSPAYAVVPVVRTDNFLEKLIHAIDLAYQEYVKEVLTAIDDIQSILSLASLPQELQGLSELFDIQGQIQQLTSQITSQKLADLSSLLAQIDLSDALSIGKLGNDLVADFEGSVGGSIKELLSKGKYDEAARAIVDRSAGIIEEKLDLPKTAGGKAPGPKKPKPGSKPDPAPDPSEIDVATAGGDASKAGMAFVKDTVPMSFPQIQKGAALTSILHTPNTLKRDILIMNQGEEVRTRVLAQTASTVAPYVSEKDSEASYRLVTKKIREKSDKVAKEAGQFSGGGASEALRATASLTAALVKQAALQNEMLILQGDVMADQVKMLGIIAAQGVDQYSRNVMEGQRRYVELYERTGSRLSQ